MLKNEIIGTKKFFVVIDNGDVTTLDVENWDFRQNGIKSRLEFIVTSIEVEGLPEIIQSGMDSQSYDHAEFSELCGLTDNDTLFTTYQEDYLLGQDEQVIAFVEYLISEHSYSIEDIDLDAITNTYQDNYEYENITALVLDDYDADEAYKDSLLSLLDDLFSEVDDFIKNYFDEGKYINDCLMDGRGPILSGYDGNEYESQNDLYVYRT